MPALTVHPVLLEDDYAGHVELQQPLYRALRVASDFFEQFGIYVHVAALKVPRLDHAIELTAENPWGQAWQAVIGGNLLGLPEGDRDEHRFLCLLRGWHDPYWIGWGGPGLAVVGDWAIERLLSMGTPEALWDDYHTAALVCHELGHVMGLGHNFDSDTDVMSYHWDRFPNSTLSQRPGAAGGAAEGCALEAGVP